MTTYRNIRLRKFRKGDERQVQKLVNDSAFVTVNRFFMEAITKEITAQILLMFSAVLFIVLGFPLQTSIAVVPIAFLSIYLVIYLGHWYKVIKTHTDLKNISDTYSDRKSFFVAEILDPSSTNYTAIFIDEDTIVDEFEKSQIVGTVAIDIKNDPDMKDSPDSVAWLRRMAVAPAHRKKGIGSRLIEVALKHCADRGFTAVELVTTQCHDSARNLYFRKGFKMKQSFHKNILGGFYSVGMCRFRKDCSEYIKKSTLNA